MTRRASIWFCLAVQAFFTFAFPQEALAAPVARAESWTEIAAEHWGVEDACPSSSVALADESRAGIAGSAYLNGCWTGPRLIYLNTALSYSWRWWCTIVVHEYGHLVGLEHSADPRSVMHSPPTHIVKGC